MLDADESDTPEVPDASEVPAPEVPGTSRADISEVPISEVPGTSEAREVPGTCNVLKKTGRISAS